ncbi:hypothetical protein AWL63_03275 [Sphingomonas panacis]|uniref:HdeD protein n=1 Tax=Sphingomonas panacis TaxID=1560345 RepID=A0A1B3Z6T1_9SPHN|nr:HdeD family acid-resistance protein [Sphingomonas panacis]AOH83141.1 hypothetical protein AWL63_03275 [Sphingomonas panacis]
MAQFATSRFGIGNDPLGLRNARGWLFALGLALLLLGLCASANLVLATVATIYYVGAMMLIGGVLQIVHAFGTRQWGSAGLWLLSGILYLLAGLVAFSNPLLAAAMLTLLLAVSLATSGVLRLWVGISVVAIGRGWLVVSGLASIAAAVIIGFQWPVNALWILGMVLAVDLIVQGIALLAAGFSIKILRTV